MHGKPDRKGSVTPNESSIVKPGDQTVPSGKTKVVRGISQEDGVSPIIHCIGTDYDPWKLEPDEIIDLLVEEFG